jgi:NAD(P)-dependent dehydrogenase (short-subunit alcohol dehydrogenase family)
MPTVLITGANRGLGLEFVRQYALADHRVIACCRHPDAADELQRLAGDRDSVALEQLDVMDHASIDALAARYRGQPIDILLNNAGIIGPVPIADYIDGQHFGTLDYAIWDQVIHTNTYGPVKLTEAFIENVMASEQKKIVALSSTIGSISERDTPAFAYATSKTALNKAMTLLAGLLRERGGIVVILCPGYVKTRMDLGGATVEIPDSVTGMRAVIDRMTAQDSGSFTRYNGERIAW